MSTWVVYNKNDDVLIHSAKGTSWEKKNHKYVEKVKSKNGVIYYKYNRKTKKYDEYDLKKEDTIPQTKQEARKFYWDQITVGLDKAKKNLLKSRGIIDNTTVANRSKVTDKNFTYDVNLQERRKKK